MLDDERAKYQRYQPDRTEISWFGGMETLEIWDGRLREGKPKTGGFTITYCDHYLKKFRQRTGNVSNAVLSSSGSNFFHAVARFFIGRCEIHDSAWRGETFFSHT